MKLNIDINDKLMAKAKEISYIKTKKAVVEKALQLYITVKTQNKLLDLRGKSELDDKAYE
jgi:Arc/MetJ family transcription regulator